MSNHKSKGDVANEALGVAVGVIVFLFILTVIIFGAIVGVITE